MAASEWLRTFVAIYRSGSVSGGAAERNLSQPAASQQLAALERRIGLPLFVRTSQGVAPTHRGRALHAEVAESLDRLEHVLVVLDGGAAAPSDPTVRFGSSAEFFSHAVVPVLAPDTPALSARFGPDDRLIDLLEHGELDIAVTSVTPGRRALDATPIGTKRFVLVGPPALTPPAPFGSLSALGGWLVGQPWVAYSAELPLTRRFWLSALGRPFHADLRLVAPDLRAVVAAVARGLGFSLLPAFACAEALTLGTVVEVHPVAAAAPAEPWFACTRAADRSRRQLTELVGLLARSAGNEERLAIPGDQPTTPGTGTPSSR
jgi:DNA-binding transcriptional LysR family regulator